MVGRQRFTSEMTDLPHLQDGGVGQRGRWTYRDWARWRFLWKFFPWYAREMRYRGDFCLGQGCMHWFWEDAEKKERGYCSAAVSRTQHMMWAKEFEEGGK